MKAVKFLKWPQLALPFFILTVIHLDFCLAESVDLERIVVTPSRTEQLLGYDAPDIDTIGYEYLEEENTYNLKDAFSSVNGVDVIGGGKFGSVAQGIYIRGGQTRHTAYMFDGIKLFDPSNPSAYYVPSDFMLTGLDRAEIIKNPLSSLYGSSALSGVVSFLPKNPQGKPYIYTEVAGGSFHTNKEIVELGGKSKGLSYLFNFSRIDSDGYSKAREKNNNPENDPYQNTNFTLNLDYRPKDGLEIGFSGRAIHSRTKNDDDDNYDGFVEDDLDNISWNDEGAATIHLKKELFQGLSYKIQGGFTSIYRQYEDDYDGHADGDNYMRAWYKGKTYQFLNNFEIAPFSFYKALVGFDYVEEVADGYRYDYNYPFAFGFISDFPKQSTHSKGFFIENIFNPWDSLEVDFSYRLEKQPVFKSHSAIKGKISYRLPVVKTQVYSSYSEGFKAPSLYQLYDPTRGNVNLRPEESKTWEVGFIQPVLDKFSFSFAYFHSDFKNLIDYVLTDPVFWIGQYVNTSKARSRGYETQINFEPLEGVKLKTGYSYLSARQDFVDEDFTTIFSRRSIRIPRNKAFFGLNLAFKKIEAGMDISYVGGRLDRIWKTVGFVSMDEFVKLKPYLLGSLSVNYKLKENFSIFMRLDNIFNKDYEVIKGYQEEKFSILGGLKAKF